MREKKMKMLQKAHEADKIPMELLSQEEQQAAEERMLAELDQEESAEVEARMLKENYDQTAVTEWNKEKMDAIKMKAAYLSKLGADAEITEDALFVYMCPPGEDCEEICECLGGFHVAVSPFVTPFIPPVLLFMAISAFVTLVLVKHFRTLHKAHQMNLPHSRDWRELMCRRRAGARGDNLNVITVQTSTTDVPLLQQGPPMSPAAAQEAAEQAQMQEYMASQ